MSFFHSIDLYIIHFSRWVMQYAQNIIWVGTISAVSYTHLDVYKRQMYITSAVLLLCNNDFIFIFCIDFPFNFDCVPFSCINFFGYFLFTITFSVLHVVFMTVRVFLFFLRSLFLSSFCGETEIEIWILQVNIFLHGFCDLHRLSGFLFLLMLLTGTH